VQVTTSDDDQVDNNIVEGVVLVASQHQLLPKISRMR
jgi:hypothetical protein